MQWDATKIVWVRGNWAINAECIHYLLSSFVNTVWSNLLELRRFKTIESCGNTISLNWSPSSARLKKIEFCHISSWKDWCTKVRANRCSFGQWVQCTPKYHFFLIIEHGENYIVKPVNKENEVRFWSAGCSIGRIHRLNSLAVLRVGSFYRIDQSLSRYQG